MSPSTLAAESPSGQDLARALDTPSAARCGATLIVIVGALRTIGFRRTLRLVRWATRNAQRAEDVPFEVAEMVARRVAIAAAFYPGRARCLEQSLTLYHRLRRLGIAAEFRVGVQPVSFAAHAWVEYRGTPILEGEIVRTVLPFPELPA